MTGIIFCFDNGMEQRIPGATIGEIVESSEDLGKNWLRYGDDYLVNTRHVVSIRRFDDERNS